MPHCFHVGCSSGSVAGSHLFKCPKNENIQELWIKNIPKQTGRVFDLKRSQLCHLHFDPKYILVERVVELNGVVMASEARKRWTITSDAVPTIFGNDKVPSYYNKNMGKRLPPKQREPLPPKKVILVTKLPLSPNSSTVLEIETSCNDEEYDNTNAAVPPVSLDDSVNSSDSTSSWKSELKQLIVKNLELIKLPSKSWTLKLGESEEELLLTMFELSKVQTPSASQDHFMPLKIVRIVQISRDFEATSYVEGKKLPLKEVRCVDEINTLLGDVATRKICTGIANYPDVDVCQRGVKNENNVWFSPDCEILCDSGLCIFCEKVRSNLSVIRCRNNKRGHRKTPSSPKKCQSIVIIDQ